MANINSLKASDGTGNAAVATIQSVRAPLATTIVVDTVENINSVFHGTMGTPHTFIDPVTSETVTVISEATAVDFQGHVDGGNLEIDTIAPGYTDGGSQVNDIVIIKPTSQWADELVNDLLVEHKQDGTHGDITADTVTAGSFIQSGTGLSGWTPGLPAVSSVTALGNRSYTVAFASDVSGTLSEGMRLRFTKTVAGNGYMGGAFNGSSHYFTKTSPGGTLGTVTNNFTIEAVVQPTAYQNGTIAARADAAGNNTIKFKMTASGQIECGVQNAGAANYRSLYSYQSLPLNKKTHVAASWTGGTVVIYFDGVSVPVATATTGGTAPTTAGTGGDFSIGRKGASATEYFPGYISNVAVFDAVLSAATIRQHATYKLLGSETNLIGAWSLDNSSSDQSSAGNNLTATGGVGYTAMSPHGQLGNGVETTKAVGLVMAVSGTDVTVQTPEGCTIPTTGGITSVSYSTQANPYGFVSDKGRWILRSRLRTIQSTTSNATYGSFIGGGYKLTVPTGKWVVGQKAGSYYAVADTLFGVSPTALTGLTANGGGALEALVVRVISTSASPTVATSDVSKEFALSTPTDFVMYTLVAATTSGIDGQSTLTEIYATPAGL